MNKYKKLGKNIGLITIGSASSKLLNFLLLPLYTSVLTSAEYGISDLVFTIVGLMLPFFTCVIYEPLMRFTLENKENSRVYFSSALIVGLFGSVLMLILSPLIFLSKTLSPYYVFVVLYYLAHALYTTLSYFTRGLEKVTVYSISGIINTLSIILLNILFLVLFKIGITGYLLAYILGQFLSSIFLFFFAQIYKHISLKDIRFSETKEMLKYSLPMMPNSISWWISNYSDKYIMLMFHSAAAMGIYSVSYKIPSLISVFSTIFSSAWQISAVEDFGSDESKRLYSSVLSVYSTFLLICSSLLIICSRILASLLFKNDFYEAWQFVPFLLIGTMFHSLSGFFGTVYTSAKKTSTLFYSTIIGAITNIILNILFIPKFAAYGAAFATMVSYIVVFIFRLVKSRQFIKFEIYYKNDILCYFILALQTVLTLIMRNSFVYLITIPLFLFVIYLRKNTVKKLLTVALRKIKVAK